jgi:hypothetical protein
VEFLEAFFATEKGQLVMAWLRAAAAALSSDNSLIPDLLTNPVVSWQLPPSLASLLDQAQRNAFTNIPVVAVVCKSIKCLVWTVEVLALFSSPTTRPTLGNLESLIMAGQYE